MEAAYLKESIVERELDGEFLILDTEANLIHQLNETASFIWRIYRSGAETEAVAAALSHEFGLEGDRALEDVHATLARLESLNIL